MIEKRGDTNSIYVRECDRIELPDIIAPVSPPGWFRLGSGMMIAGFANLIERILGRAIF